MFLYLCPSVEVSSVISLSFLTSSPLFPLLSILAFFVSSTFCFILSSPTFIFLLSSLRISLVSSNALVSPVPLSLFPYSLLLISFPTHTFLLFTSPPSCFLPFSFIPLSSLVLFSLLSVRFISPLLSKSLLFPSEKFIVLWSSGMWSFVHWYNIEELKFRRHLLPPSSVQKLAVASSFETQYVSTTRRHIPEDYNLNDLRRHNRKFTILMYFITL